MILPLMLASCNVMSSSGDSNHPVVEKWLELSDEEPSVALDLLLGSYGDTCFNFREVGELHVKTELEGVLNQGSYCIEDDLVIQIDQVRAVVISNDGVNYEVWIEWNGLQEYGRAYSCQTHDFETGEEYTLLEMQEQLGC